ncbi:MAG: hypothetical protein GTN60_21290 [Pseudomonas stutzeri]|nr:hypothetical protein [Stutzerimonas stutzeri]NIN83075.1 hypothetical protein [Stutzerimonas stutzeri]NIP03211.1 hypothetical protein [Stutzerimonas stutzeri]NIT43204.1 hypothetical protein [Stutzerimonas stutzeri]
MDGNAVAIRYRVQGIPAFFVIAPDGTLLHRSSGFSDSKVDIFEAYMKQYAK